MVILQIESAKPLFSPPVWRQGGGNMRTYKEYYNYKIFYILYTLYNLFFYCKYSGVLKIKNNLWVRRKISLVPMVDEHKRVTPTCA